MSRIERQIFGISDSASFFVEEDQRPLLAEALVSLRSKRNPAICYIGAAKGDEANRIAQFEKFAVRLNLKPKVLSFFNPETGNPDDYFSGIDIIFIDGGSTRNLMAIFAEWGVVAALKKAYERGVIIAGASAGLNIMFDWNITDSIKTQIVPHQGYGLLTGSICVHYDAHPDRPGIFNEFLNNGRATFPGYAVDEGVALHFVDGHLKTIYSIHSEAGLQMMSKTNGQVVTSSVDVTPLGQTHLA